jgi:hypothetical protein
MLLHNESVKLPYPVRRRSEDVVDLLHVREELKQASETSRENGGSVLPEVLKSAFLTLVNLHDFDDPSWPRVRPEHLDHGYDVRVAWEYVLHRTDRRSEAVPPDFTRFPALFLEHDDVQDVSSAQAEPAGPVAGRLGHLLTPRLPAGLTLVARGEALDLHDRGRFVGGCDFGWLLLNEEYDARVRLWNYVWSVLTFMSDQVFQVTARPWPDDSFHAAAPDLRWDGDDLHLGYIDTSSGAVVLEVGSVSVGTMFEAGGMDTP